MKCPPLAVLTPALAAALFMTMLYPSETRSNGFRAQNALSEHFESLTDWEIQLFPKVSKASDYSIEKRDNASFLEAESAASASGLRWKGEFDPYEFPVLRWRWKVSRVYDLGDASKKSGDDYPARLYVVFKYDPKDPSIRKSLKYIIARLFYKKYPPHSSLNYIWGNKERDRKAIPNAYTKRNMMIPVQSGSSLVGQWVTNEANIIQDYRKAFGTDPPRTAGIAVMNDSDNTGESSISYFDYIEVSKY